MKNYINYINEKIKIDQELLLDLFSYFYKILKIHEKHFYNDDKICNDESFKSKVNTVFTKLLSGKKCWTEEFYNLIHDYEKKLYNDDKITPEGNFGCSMWDVCDVILEDQSTLNINRYIQDFSDSDIYVELEQPDYSDVNIDFGDDVENDNVEAPPDKYVLTEFDLLYDKAFDIAKEKYDDEIDIVDFAIDILKSYKKDYPQYIEDWEDAIEEWEEYKKLL